MWDPGRIFMILIAIFLLQAFLWNIIKTDLPKLPGDIYLDKAGFTIYIPFVSSIVISVLLTILTYYFKAF